MTYSDLPGACDVPSSIASMAHHAASHATPTASQAAIAKLTAAHTAHHASHGIIAWWLMAPLKIKAAVIALPCIIFGPPIALYAPPVFEYATKPAPHHGYYAVPEPSSLALFAIASVAIILIGRRRHGLQD